MINKIVIVDKNEIANAGEMCPAEIVNEGIILKPSDKSNIKYWFPLEEVRRVILPDASEVSSLDFRKLPKLLNEFIIKYGLED